MWRSSNDDDDDDDGMAAHGAHRPRRPVIAPAEDVHLDTTDTRSGAKKKSDWVTMFTNGQFTRRDATIHYFKEFIENDRATTHAHESSVADTGVFGAAAGETLGTTAAEIVLLDGTADAHSFAPQRLACDRAFAGRGCEDADDPLVQLRDWGMFMLRRVARAVRLSSRGTAVVAFDKSPLMPIFRQPESRERRRLKEAELQQRLEGVPLATAAGAAARLFNADNLYAECPDVVVVLADREARMAMFAFAARYISHYLNDEQCTALLGSHSTVHIIFDGATTDISAPPTMYTLAVERAAHFSAQENRQIPATFIHTYTALPHMWHMLGEADTALLFWVRYFSHHRLMLCTVDTDALFALLLYWVQMCASGGRGCAAASLDVHCAPWDTRTHSVESVQHIARQLAERAVQHRSAEHMSTCMPWFRPATGDPTPPRPIVLEMTAHVGPPGRTATRRRYFDIPTLSTAIQRHMKVLCPAWGTRTVETLVAAALLSGVDTTRGHAGITIATHALTLRTFGNFIGPLVHTDAEAPCRLDDAAVWRYVCAMYYTKWVYTNAKTTRALMVEYEHLLVDVPGGAEDTQARHELLLAILMRSRAQALRALVAKRNPKTPQYHMPEDGVIAAEVCRLSVTLEYTQTPGLWDQTPMFYIHRAAMQGGYLTREDGSTHFRRSIST